MTRTLSRSLSLLLLAAFAATAADWPQFRGPHRDAVSEETGLAKSWPADGPALLWKQDGLGSGYGTLAVVGERAYLIANRGMGSEYVVAISTEDGGRLWSAELGPVGMPDMQPPYAAARSTPTVVGDALFALSSNGDLAAVQLATGEVLWRKSLLADFGGASGRWAYAESPLVDGDTLVVTPGGEEATIVALNPANGETIWASAIPGGDPAGFASAMPSQAGGRKQYVQFLDGGVVGVDAETGVFLWRYNRTASGPANATTPIINGDYIYSGNSRRFGGALVQVASEGASAEEVYFQRAAPNTMGGQALVDGVLYGTNGDGLTATDFETGEQFWQSGGGPGSVQFADGHIYVHWEEGDVSLVEATPEAFREKGRFTPQDPPPAPPVDGRNKMTWTYPVVANGKLYIRDHGTVWCYDVSSN